jgi:hypothetical protein
MTALEPQLYLAKVLDLNGPSTHDISNLQKGDISILRLQSNNRRIYIMERMDV